MGYLAEVLSITAAMSGAQYGSAYRSKPKPLPQVWAFAAIVATVFAELTDASASAGVDAGQPMKLTTSAAVGIEASPSGTITQ